MKKLLGIAIIAFSISVITACSDNKSPKSFDDFRTYVMDHKNNAQQQYDKDWNEIETEYNNKKAEAEKDMDKWSDAMKTEYGSLQADWEVFHDSYKTEAARKEAEMKVVSFQKSLLPEGIMADMSNITAKNLLSVHEHFVNFVSNHKDEMSREDWDQAEILWERLGTRKNEVEKELPKGDNMKIAELKIKYGAIKATNRPSAKADENADAKK